MDFIHTREYLGGGDTIVVKVSHKCHVRVMDDANFQNYRNGFSKYTFVGGYYTTSPIRIVVPQAGNWNIAIDLGGKIAKDIKYGISFLKKRG
jgi:Domain of unknown function (DUF1883)